MAWQKGETRQWDVSALLGKWQQILHPIEIQVRRCGLSCSLQRPRPANAVLDRNSKENLKSYRGFKAVVLSQPIKGTLLNKQI
jgi:hypothetical protein